MGGVIGDGDMQRLLHLAQVGQFLQPVAPLDHALIAGVHGKAGIAELLERELIDRQAAPKKLEHKALAEFQGLVLALFLLRLQIACQQADPRGDGLVLALLNIGVRGRVAVQFQDGAFLGLRAAHQSGQDRGAHFQDVTLGAVLGEVDAEPIVFG